MTVSRTRSRSVRLTALIILWLFPAPVLGQGFHPLGELPEWFLGTILLPGRDPMFTTVAEFVDAPRCLVHEMSVPTQGMYLSGSGMYLSGSVGGLVLGTSVSILDETTDAEIGTAISEPPGQALSQRSSIVFNQYFSQLARPPSSGDTTVVILVADNFGGEHFSLPEELESPDPTVPLALDRLETLVASGDLSHGAIVLHHLGELIHETGSTQSTADPYGLSGWLFQNGPFGGLVVAPVDLWLEDQAASDGLLESWRIARAIKDAVEGVVEGLELPPGQLKLVVNMSWVLLPCATVEEFMAVRDSFKTFKQYMEALEIDGLPATSEADELANRFALVSWVGSGDPLVSLLRGFQSSEVRSELRDFLTANETEIVFVAAAGNFSMDYQMVPAASPAVLGVGAPIHDQPPPDFSNASDVSAPGAWFHINGLVSYGGTSFSAPLASLVAAADLLGTGKCVPEGNTGRPGFGIPSPSLLDRRLLGDAAMTCNFP